jgi:hypothetical protein
MASPSSRPNHRLSSTTGKPPARSEDTTTHRQYDDPWATQQHVHPVVTFDDRNQQKHHSTPPATDHNTYVLQAATYSRHMIGKPVSTETVPNIISEIATVHAQHGKITQGASPSKLLLICPSLAASSPLSCCTSPRMLFTLSAAAEEPRDLQARANRPLNRYDTCTDTRHARCMTCQHVHCLDQQCKMSDLAGIAWPIAQKRTL